MLPLLLILLYVTRKKIHLKQYLTNNIVWITAIISLFLFILFTKHASEHSRFGFELFALILIATIVLKLNLSNRIYYCINAIIIIGLSFYILPANARNYQEYKRVTDIIQKTNNELIITQNDRYNQIHDRFNIYYIPKEDSEFHNVYNSSAWENTLISDYYKKKKLIFIPHYIQEDLLIPHKFDKFFTTNNYPVYIKEINPINYIRKVTFILNETDYSSLPFYIRPFAEKFDRYRLTNLNTDKFSVINFNGKSYLFVGKNYMINSRVKEIIYE
jgi:hypothetical protein